MDIPSTSSCLPVKVEGEWERRHSSSSDSPLQPHPTNRKKGARFATPCAVCGKAANSFHYDVPACMGCKTFFRRIIVNRIRLICDFDNDCLLNPPDSGRRRTCRRCRFERCVDMGMNPLAVVSETEPLTNDVVVNILQRRRKKPSTTDDNITKHELIPVSPVKKSPIYIPLQVMEERIEHLIRGLLRQESAHERIRRSKYNPRVRDGHTLDSLISQRPMLFDDFGEMPDWPPELYKVPLDPDNRLLATEQHVKEKIPFPTYKVAVLPDNLKVWTIADIVYAVEYLKSFEFFHILDFKDKKVLSRHVTLMCAHITAAFFSYEHKSDMMIMPDEFMPFKGKLPDSEYEWCIYKKMISMMIELKIDKQEYVLLKALVVCNPAVMDLSNLARRILTEEHTKFAKSLLSYCVSNRGQLMGPSVYGSIVSIVDTLSHIIKRQKEMFVLVDVAKLRVHLYQAALLQELHYA